jgi:hypothetical protein
MSTAASSIIFSGISNHFAQPNSTKMLRQEHKSMLAWHAVNNELHPTSPSMSEARLIIKELCNSLLARLALQLHL